MGRRGQGRRPHRGGEAQGALGGVPGFPGPWSRLHRGPAAIADGPENFTPIGAGAFTFDNYAPGEHLLLKANPNHWDGAPYLDNLRFVWLGADQTKYESFNSGNVQAAHIIDPSLVEELAVAEMPRFTSVQNNGQVIMINQGDGNPGQYPQVRRAIAHAIDPKTVADRVVDGKGYYGKTMFAPISHWYDDSVEVNAFDPEQARRLLEEAEAEGFDGRITLTAADSPVNQETVMTLKAQLDAAGFETDTDLVRNLADFIARIFIERNYSVAQTGLGLVDNDPFQNIYSAYTTNGSSNVTGFSNPEMDRLVGELRAIPLEDEDAMRQKLHEIETLVQDEVPLITYRYFTPTVLWSEDVHGIVGLNEVMVDFGKAWIEE